jgi:hypothetical protein
MSQRKNQAPAGDTTKHKRKDGMADKRFKGNKKS